MATNFRYGANPSAQQAMAGSGSGGFGGAIQGILSNPDFLSLMAGIGSRMDPEGAGGAIGEPVQQTIQSQAQAQAAEKQNQQMERLIEAIGEREGSIKQDRDGAISVNLKSKLAKEGEGDLRQPAKLQTPGRAEHAQETQEWLIEDMNRRMETMFNFFGRGR